ncbi:hypothetical protein U1Q18_032635, partial [Sarracenia purpurea var. burkii]
APCSVLVGGGNLKGSPSSQTGGKLEEHKASVQPIGASSWASIVTSKGDPKQPTPRLNHRSPVGKLEYVEPKEFEWVKVSNRKSSKKGRKLGERQGNEVKSATNQGYTHPKVDDAAQAYAPSICLARHADQLGSLDQDQSVPSTADPTCTSGHLPSPASHHSKGLFGFHPLKERELEDTDTGPYDCTPERLAVCLFRDGVAEDPTGWYFRLGVLLVCPCFWYDQLIIKFWVTWGCVLKLLLRELIPSAYIAGLTWSFVKACRACLGQPMCSLPAAAVGPFSLLFLLF